MSTITYAVGDWAFFRRWCDQVRCGNFVFAARVKSVTESWTDWSRCPSCKMNRQVTLALRGDSIRQTTFDRPIYPMDLDKGHAEMLRENATRVVHGPFGTGDRVVVTFTGSKTPGTIIGYYGLAESRPPPGAAHVWLVRMEDGRESPYNEFWLRAG